MGAIDGFASRQFGAALRPGESLELIGIGTKARTDAAYVLVGVTSQRLLLLDCPADAWMNAPRPETTATSAFEYRDIGEAVASVTNGLHGHGKRLVLKAAGNEVNLVFMAAPKTLGNVWNYTGFDGHVELHDLFPEWLARHVAGGSFRSPQGCSGAIGELRSARAARASQAHHQMLYAQQASIAAEAAKSIKWPYVLMVMSILGVGLGAFMCFRGSELEQRAEAGRQTIRDHASTKGDYLEQHPERAQQSLADADERIEWAKSTISTGLGVTGAGAVGVACFLALGITLNKKKRARLGVAAPA